MSIIDSKAPGYLGSITCDGAHKTKNKAAAKPIYRQFCCSLSRFYCTAVSGSEFFSWRFNRLA